MATDDGRELWHVLRARERRTWPSPSQPLVYVSAPSDVIDLMRARSLSKAPFAARASQSLTGTQWGATIVETALILQDGASHARLRQALDRFWTTNAIDDITARVRADAASITESGAPSAVASAAVRSVLRVLGGVGVPDLVTRLVQKIAPELNQAMTSGSVVSTELCCELDDLCDAIQLWATTAPPGSVPGVLRDVLEPDEVVGLTVFVLVAAVETVQTLVMLAMRAAQDPIGQRTPARELLDNTPPVPYAYYATTRDIDVGQTTVANGTALALCLARDPASPARLAFGLGAHHCFGARLALAVAEILLDVLPIQPPRSWSWDRDRFTWALRPHDPEQPVVR